MSKVSLRNFLFKWTTALLILAFILGASGVWSARAATLTVTNLDDSGAGSLRQEILDANANAGADTITFNISRTITLASTLPAISDGAGLTIDGTGQTITISGNNSVRVMIVNSGAVLTLKNLTLSDGKTQNQCDGDWNGGGICSLGALNVMGSTFSGNRTDFGTGHGGAIYSHGGTLTVTDSTFSGNSTFDYYNLGGGIASSCRKIHF